MADELDLDSEGICSFEDLEATLQKLKNKSSSMFFGCCCEEFYIRHKRELDSYGIPGVLIDIDSSTCYELGKALAAYKGEFENQTNLRMDMVEKILALRGSEQSI
jgi:lipoate-protein ligase A